MRVRRRLRPRSLRNSTPDPLTCALEIFPKGSQSDLEASLATCIGASFDYCATDFRSISSRISRRFWTGKSEGVEGTRFARH